MYKETEPGLSNGAAIVIVGLMIGGLATKGDYWDYSQEKGLEFNNFALLEETNTADTSTPVDTQPVTPAAPATRQVTGDIEADLRSAGSQEAWCSNLGIQVHNRYLSLSVNSAEQVDGFGTAEVCLDESTIELRTASDGQEYFMAYMRTKPRISQVEDAPSLFLTLGSNDLIVAKCLDAKEEMRDQVEDALEEQLGRQDAAKYEVEIHVDRRNMRHACDDQLFEP